MTFTNQGTSSKTISSVRLGIPVHIIDRMGEGWSLQRMVFDAIWEMCLCLSTGQRENNDRMAFASVQKPGQ
jgi:hypothetical protein